LAKRISDEAVKKSTGRIWKEWFTILEKMGAKEMEHKDIAKLLFEKHALSLWWSQMVTVQYEQDVKGRKKHEKPEGFQISRSITIPFSVSKIFNAVQSTSQRKIWLRNSDFKISRSTRNKSIRGKWVDDKANIEFQFYPKDNNKTQLVVEQSKIRTSREAERMKKYWEKNLNDLKNFLNKN